MDEFEDYSEEITRRTVKLSYEKLSCCVTANHLVDEGLYKVYRELDVDSCLSNNWKKLAGVLLKPPPTAATIELLSRSKSQACELFKTWVSQSNECKTFDSLIEAMVECKLYSACDELLDYLEALNLDLDERYEGEVPEPNPATSHIINTQEGSENLDEIVAIPVDVGESGETSEQPNTRLTNEQRQKRPYPPTQRSNSYTGKRSRAKKFMQKIKNPFKRSMSYPPDIYPLTSTLAPSTEPTPELPKDEIFFVSSFADNNTEGLKDLMSFVRGLKVVKTGNLTVRTIHDIDQGGLVTTAWLEERVYRARFVILCFSDNMKKVTEETSQFKHQSDYSLKFLIDLVSGTILYNCGRNPDGKFIPVVLGRYNWSAVTGSLRRFQNFCWPDEQERIRKYILNLPEYPVPRQGCRKPLVAKEMC